MLHYAATTRRFLVLAVAIGGATALLVVAQAWLIATIVADAFVHHRSLASVRTPVLLLAATVLGRSFLAWLSERAAHRASASAKSELRRAAAERVAALGPAGLEGRDTGELSVLMTTGIDALDGYFARYLPQLFLAVIVPVTIIGVVAGADWVSAALIAVSLPLIPLFMALVGSTTRDRTAARMRSLQQSGRPLPRRHGGAPHAEDLRTRQGPGPLHCRRHRPLPLSHHGDAPAHLPFVPDP